MKKRILIISDIAVYPPNSGHKSRVWALMNNLRDMGHEVWFFGLGQSEATFNDLRGAWGEHVRYIPKVPVREVRPFWFAVMRFFSKRLVDRGLLAPSVDHWYWPHWDKALRELAAEHAFDVAMVEYVFFSRALENFPANVRKIVDAHDVFTGRREKLMARNIGFIGRYLASAREEARGLNRGDVVIGIQENESKFFRELLGPSKRVVTVGHTVQLQPMPRPAGVDIVFLGSSYPVNIDGLMHFMDKSLPRIRAAVPGARLLIAGTICGALKISADGVELLGEVKDVGEAYRRATVIINPVLTGTGLKIKTIEALASGRPLVTTSWGADGLREGAGSVFLMADEPDQFADGVIALLTQPEQADAMGQTGLKFVERWNEEQRKGLSLAISENS